MTKKISIEHRLKLAIDDASYLLNHLQSGGDMEDITTEGDRAWSLWANVKIALDLSDDTCYDWVTSEAYNNKYITEIVNQRIADSLLDIQKNG